LRAATIASEAAAMDIGLERTPSNRRGRPEESVDQATTNC
jgi:hypothetical protein